MTKPPQRLFRKAFTLLEVMLATAVMALLASAVFFLVQGSLQSIGILNQSRSRQHELDGVNILLRGLLSRLPAGSIIQTRPLMVAHDEATPTLDITDAADRLGMGEHLPPTAVIRFAIVPEAGGRYCLELRAMTRTQWNHESVAEANETAAELSPLPLISGLDGISWRFYDSHNQQWRKDWQDMVSHPALIELTLNAPETPPYIAVFQLPNMVPPPLTGNGPDTPQ